MSIMKAKEFDRLGNQRRLQEAETKLKDLEYTNQILQKENEHLKQSEEELNFLKRNVDSDFDQFGKKLEEITAELERTQTENTSLKKTEEILRGKVSQITKERNDLLSQLDNIENIDVSFKDN